jgi:hypothetical protein
MVVRVASGVDGICRLARLLRWSGPAVLASDLALFDRCGMAVIECIVWIVAHCDLLLGLRFADGVRTQAALEMRMRGSLAWNTRKYVHAGQEMEEFFGVPREPICSRDLKLNQSVHSVLAIAQSRRPNQQSRLLILMPQSP